MTREKSPGLDGGETGKRIACTSRVLTVSQTRVSELRALYVYNNTHMAEK